jgi:hypothetical protein
MFYYTRCHATFDYSTVIAPDADRSEGVRAVGKPPTSGML